MRPLARLPLAAAHGPGWRCARWSVHLHEDEQSPALRAALGATGQPVDRWWHTLTVRLEEDVDAAAAERTRWPSGARAGGRGAAPARALPRVLHLILDRAPGQSAVSVLAAAFNDAAFAHELLTEAARGSSGEPEGEPVGELVRFALRWERMVQQAWALAQPAEQLLSAYRQRVPASTMAAEHHAQLEMLQAAMHGIGMDLVHHWRRELREHLPYTASVLHRPSVAAIAYWHLAGFSPALLATWRGPHPGPLVEDPALPGAWLLPFARAGWSAREHQQLARTLGAQSGADRDAAVAGGAVGRWGAQALRASGRACAIDVAWAEVPVADALLAAEAGLSAREVLTALATGNWDRAAAHALAALRRPPG